jgi:hypothetical protein
MFGFALFDFWVLRKGSMTSWIADASRKTVLFKWAYSARSAILLCAVVMSLSASSQQHPIAATIDLEDGRTYLQEHLWAVS